MLLHLLVNITNLPVTKAAIKDSGMGITIGAIGKHAICKDTPNEHAIKEKINQLKDSWNSSVKAKKAFEAGKEPVKVKVLKALSPPFDSSKREAPGSVSTNSPVKRLKMDVSMDQKMDAEPKKATLFNALIKTVKSGSPSGVGASSKLYSKPNESAVALNPSRPVSFTSKEDNSKAIASKRDQIKQGRFFFLLLSNLFLPYLSRFSIFKDIKFKKSSLRVKWADHFGGQLSMVHEVEGEVIEKSLVQETAVSWSDRKRRDRLREKELLTKAK